MGLITGKNPGKEIFSAKHDTALIIDSQQQAHFITIKKVIGDYFIWNLKDELFCFKVDGRRLITYRETGAKSFRFYIYNTNNYLPASPENVKKLEDILTQNHLPKRVNEKLLDTFKILGNKEKKIKEGQKFTPHDLVKLAEEIDELKDPEAQDKIQNMVNFLKELSVKEIVTPVRELSEFLENDVRPKDAKFLGDLFSQLQRVDNEHKKISNTKKTAKGPLLKVIIIVAIVAAIGVMIAVMAQSGALGHILPSFGGTTQATPTQLMQEYPTPEAMKRAIQEGKLDYNSLTPDLKKAVDAIQLPATPLVPQYSSSNRTH